MRKAIITAALVVASAATAAAQVNLQTFYDFGKDRKHATTTLEMYKGDKWGDTFFFVDYDYATKDMRKENFHGAKGSYFEIARGINLWQDTKFAPISAHVEFNSGVDFGNCNWLFGANYFLHSKDFKNTLTLELLFKTYNYSRTDSQLPLQFTVVWGMEDLFNVKGLKFSGFADIWGEDTAYWYGDENPLAHDKAHFVFISEPQLWYRVGQHFGVDNLNVGGEVELSYNFAGCHGFKCRPCLGVKWDF